jgi:hypothetical protein
VRAVKVNANMSGASDAAQATKECASKCSILGQLLWRRNGIPLRASKSQTSSTTTRIGGSTECRLLLCARWTALSIGRVEERKRRKGKAAEIAFDAKLWQGPAVLHYGVMFCLVPISLGPGPAPFQLARCVCFCHPGLGALPVHVGLHPPPAGRLDHIDTIAGHQSVASRNIACATTTTQTTDDHLCRPELIIFATHLEQLWHWR